MHGDYRVGNVLFDPRVRVVLDWEQAHVGDPMEDLGWMCVRAWRFGSPLPVGGIGERDEFFSAYEGAGGGPLSIPAWCGSGKPSGTSSGRSFASRRPKPISTAA